jgi:N-acetylglucosaminyldiphosphoundecaprenol N-acetyl-beta-D-mannosaminyltransferase
MNKPTKVDILSVQVDALTIKEANNMIASFIHQPRKSASRIVVKPYVEFLVTARRDSKIATMLNTADLCIADGVSLQWAASYLYGEPHKKALKVPRSGLKWLQNSNWRSQIIPEKMAGATQTTDLLYMAEANHWRVGIIGGVNSPDQIKDAVKERFPNLTHLSTWSGFYKLPDEPKLTEDIASAKLDLLLVAMGFPRQEEFMIRNQYNGLAKVMIGEGGTFDYEQMGGPIRRAPMWMQKGGLEWAWRLTKQPKRFSRQLGIPKFVWAVRSQARHKNKL